MASTITPSNIDGGYPVSGQDNDSQGFRTNFTNIRNNLTTAKNEIDDLHEKVVLKQALIGGAVNNDFGGTTMLNAKIQDFSETVVEHGLKTGNVTVDHRNGHYQRVATTGSITLVFSNWPTITAGARLGRVRVEVEITNIDHTVTLPGNVNIGADTILGNVAGVITFSNAGTYIFEFTTDDNGATIAVNDLSRPRTVNITSRTPLPEGQIGDVSGMIATDGAFVYICYGSYDGVTSIWMAATLVPVLIS